jgi:hypothetical protein
MRGLFDENVDWRLRRFLEPEHEVATVTECGWSGKKNGDLLRVAEIEFDALSTMDKNLRHQQDLARFDLAFVLVEAPSSRRKDIEPLMNKVASVLGMAQSGRLYVVAP